MARKKTKVMNVSQTFSVKDNKMTCVLKSVIKLDDNDIIYFLMSSDQHFLKFVVNNYKIYYNYENNVNEVYLEYITIGKAKCLKEDKFDKDFGTKVSLTRAQKKAFDKARLLFNEAYSCINKYAGDIHMLSNNCEENSYKSNDHVNNLINNFYKN